MYNVASDFYESVPLKRMKSVGSMNGKQRSTRVID